MPKGFSQLPALGSGSVKKTTVLDRRQFVHSKLDQYETVGGAFDRAEVLSLIDGFYPFVEIQRLDLCF